MSPPLNTNTRYFDLYGVYADRRVLEGLLARGIVQGAVVLPETLSRSVAAGEPVEVQILIDGSNGTTAGALQGYLRAVVADVVTEAAVNASGSVGGGRSAQLETRVWFNPEMDSSRYLIPGLVAFILVITGVISTALSIVREKELGTLEQISASPLSPVTLVLGKTLPYMALSAALAVAVFAAGYVFFGVDVAGGIGWLAVVTALFLFASLGLGILISSIADTQQVAFMVSILITFLPAFILSGFIFPIESMPHTDSACDLHRAGAVLHRRIAGHHVERRRTVGVLAGRTLPGRLCRRDVGGGCGAFENVEEPPVRMLRYLVWKEFIQLGRDRKMLPLVFVAPVVQLILLGFAADLDVQHLKTAVLDRDTTAMSRRVVRTFVAGDSFDLAGYVSSPAEAERLLLDGRASVVLTIPQGFSRAVQGGAGHESPPRLQLLVDGTNSVVGTSALNYAAGIAADLEGRLVGSVEGPTSPKPPPTLSIHSRVWYNPTMETKNFMVPGILAMLLMLVTMVLSSLAIVKEKELGTLEQLNVTPISSRQLIIGKLVPFIVIGVVDIALVLVVSQVVFAVPFRGSTVLLFGASLLFLASTLGLGLLISTVSHTQQQAMLTSAFFCHDAHVLPLGLCVSHREHAHADTSAYLRLSTALLPHDHPGRVFSREWGRRCCGMSWSHSYSSAWRSSVWLRPRFRKQAR